MKNLEKYSPYVLALLRIVAAYMFILHRHSEIPGIPNFDDGGLMAQWAIHWMSGARKRRGQRFQRFVTVGFNHKTPKSLN